MMEIEKYNPLVVINKHKPNDKAFPLPRTKPKRKIKPKTKVEAKGWGTKCEALCF